eukprot:1137601-Pelagomonas_calceolata.AAC.3
MGAHRYSTRLKDLQDNIIALQPSIPAGSLATRALQRCAAAWQTPILHCFSWMGPIQLVEDPFISLCETVDHAGKLS